ncbi:GDSL-type esterase/lipase family protein [Telluribacter sp.]|jgi:lysophospholipase L1-like esterase|uniref:GDSL-type esterase/lipase family protein n=1 Tax=Telluribacter sp. TaxID=1978767 RepID=UPI002E0D2E19|nr:GDSL-type esterase/lipase family protein [Telluribacter sp.]
MLQKKVRAVTACLLVWLLTLPGAWVAAQTTTPPTGAAFSLKNGDRVVFLGNSLFENDLQYGYLELALTTRWPDRNVTYRNIGWTGDNVFGEARSYITNPPTPYDLLIEQLTKAKPTVVFVAYGGIEAQEGEAGLPRFTEGLHKLLDKINELGAKAILLSPIPVMSAEPGTTAPRNAMLERYGAAIARTASERGLRYIDIFKPIQEISRKTSVSDNGIHLNEAGYYYLASALENGLGLPARQEVHTINASKSGNTASAPVKLVVSESDKSSLKFTMDAPYLPLTPPKEDGRVMGNGQTIRITGLKKGFYTLTADGAQVLTASAKQWAEGVALTQGPLMAQASQLREMIVKKNELFFHQYRPQNRTYIVGFRSYEQGRHVKGLEDLNFIITWLEGQIALRRMPPSPVYQLSQLN